MDTTPDQPRHHVVTLDYHPPRDEVTLSVRYWGGTPAAVWTPNNPDRAPLFTDAALSIAGRTWGPGLRIPEALFRVIQRAILSGVEPAEGGAEWVAVGDGLVRGVLPDRASGAPPPVLQDAELAKARVLAAGLEESMRAARMAVGLPPLPFAELSKALALAEALLESLDAMRGPRLD